MKIAQLLLAQGRQFIYYSKFAKDQLFDIAYFSPIANDNLYEDLIIVYLSYRFVMYSLHYLYLIPLNQFSYFITNTQK